MSTSDQPMSATARPSRIQAADGAVGRMHCWRGLAIGEPHLIDQRAVAIGKIDNTGGSSARRQRACEALDQPSAERIQPLQLFHVDVDALRILAAAPSGNDDPLKFGGALGRPGTGDSERDVRVGPAVARTRVGFGERRREQGGGHRATFRRFKPTRDGS